MVGAGEGRGRGEGQGVELSRALAAPTGTRNPSSEGKTDDRRSAAARKLGKISRNRSGSHFAGFERKSATFGQRYSYLQDVGATMVE